MRQTITCLSLVVAMLAAGCGGGGIEGDLKKSGETLRKDAEKMSDAELEKKMADIEAYGKEFEKKVGGGEPNKADMEKMTKLIEIAGIYGTELLKRKMK